MQDSGDGVANKDDTVEKKEASAGGTEAAFGKLNSKNSKITKKK